MLIDVSGIIMSACAIGEGKSHAVPVISEQMVWLATCQYQDNNRYRQQ